MLRLKRNSYYDYALLAVIVILMCFGLVMLYSVSSYTAEIKTGDDYKRYCYLLWLNRQPYEEIVEGIKQLAAAVASALG